MTWSYKIKKIEDDPAIYALVEQYKGGEIDGAYVTVIDGGTSRKDIVAMLQLAVLDTFTDKEMEQLQNMWQVRKDVKKKRA